MIYNKVEFDEFGFRALGLEATRILWSDIIRVAYCMVVDSVALKVEDYWAFQTTDPNLITWVHMNPYNDFIRKSFSEEIHRRFGEVDIPERSEWNQSKKDQGIHTYVIYPEADSGQPMYIFRRERWWSLESKLHHAQR